MASTLADHTARWVGAVLDDFEHGPTRLAAIRFDPSGCCGLVPAPLTLSGLLYSVHLTRWQITEGDPATSDVLVFQGADGGQARLTRT